MPGQQLVQAVLRHVGDACEHVGKPGFRVDVVETRRHEKLGRHNSRSAPRSEPANNHAFLPRAKPRNARSAALLMGMMFSALKPGGEDWSSGLVCRSRDRGAGARNGGRPP